MKSNIDRNTGQYLIATYGMRMMMELKDVISKIRDANDAEISEMIKAIVQRYEAVYPGWEVLFLSLPKDDPDQRRRYLEAAFGILQKSE